MTNKQKQEEIDNLLQVLNHVHYKLWDLELIATASKLTEIEESLIEAHAYLSVSSR